MSDITPAASTETASSSSSTPSSTPVDTASIAASVIRDAEAGNSDTQETTQQTTPEQGAEAAREAARQQQQQQAADDDFDAVEAETVDSLGRKRVNSIPHPRVQKMIAKKEKAVIAQIAKELGISKAEAELTLDDVLGNVRERGTKYSEYEQRVQVMDSVEAIMEQDGDRFIRMLAEANPQTYGKFLKVLEAATEQAQAQGTQAQGDDDPEPQPTYPLGDGTFTYSLDDMKKVRAWERRQGKKETESLLNERLKPFEEDRKAREKQKKIQEIHTEATKALDRLLDKASKWPGFLENQEAIGKLITENPQMELVDAYMQVVPQKLTANRTTMRQELLAEINSQPHSTSVQTSPTAPQKQKGPKTTEEIAREVIAQFTT
jgi:hypothetical protein